MGSCIVLRSEATWKPQNLGSCSSYHYPLPVITEDDYESNLSEDHVQGEQFFFCYSTAAVSSIYAAMQHTSQSDIIVTSSRAAGFSYYRIIVAS